MAVSQGGLPIGVELVGRPHDDGLILELAVRLEGAQGLFAGMG
jgi:Asp-tRNA(Asn)/Glu-tRNA(Gln) amidotransferase A subunit family amidase